MKTEIDINGLKEIYLISNTASFFLDGFSNNDSIRCLSQNHSTVEMIATFSEIAKTEINELDDLVFAYSLYVAIILKNDTPAYKFLMSDKSSINFEWFLDLRSIYLARLKPVDIFVFDTAYSSIKIPKTYSESSEYVNNQTIELA